MESQTIRYYPIALFSSVMGFAAGTIAVSMLEEIYRWNSFLSLAFLTLTTILFLINIGILFYRFIRYPRDVQMDFNHPVQMNFFAAISISLLLLANAYSEIFQQLSFILWLLGALMQLSLTIIFLTKMMRNSSLQVAQFTPVSFIPIVGNLVVPIAGSYHVNAHFNWFFFGVGALFSIIYMTLIFQRLYFHGPLPKQLMPTLFILLAPPSVGIIAYVNTMGQTDVFAQVLYGIAFFIALFLTAQLKKIFTLPFFISAWALLFPSGAFTVATIRMFNATGIIFYEWTYTVLIIGLILLISYLTWNTLRMLRKGTLCVPSE